MNKQQLIAQLGLEQHIEGGYFRRIFTSEHQGFLGNDKRQQMSSIYYLLCKESPIGHFHKNRSDILHFFLSGSPIRYDLLDSNGQWHQVTLGPDLDKGHRLSFLAPGGFLKASELLEGEYGLIAEAVSPGFDFSDMQLATGTQIRNLCPTHWQILENKIHPDFR